MRKAGYEYMEEGFAIYVANKSARKLTVIHSCLDFDFTYGKKQVFSWLSPEPKCEITEK